MDEFSFRQLVLDWDVELFADEIQAVNECVCRCVGAMNVQSKMLILVVVN
jgi:hypothetical protein